MQFTIATLLAVASLSLAAPSSGTGPEDNFLAYGHGDTTCQDQNTIKSFGIPGSFAVGDCYELPEDTNSILFRIAGYATATNGCVLTLSTSSACATADEGQTINNGDLVCRPATTGASGVWKSLKVTCPSS